MVCAVLEVLNDSAGWGIDECLPKRQKMEASFGFVLFTLSGGVDYCSFISCFNKKTQYNPRFNLRLCLILSAEHQGPKQC